MPAELTVEVAARLVLEATGAAAEVVGTGGGCTALSWPLTEHADGTGRSFYVLVTEAEDVSFGAGPMTGGLVLGVYPDDEADGAGLTCEGVQWGVDVDGPVTVREMATLLVTARRALADPCGIATAPDHHGARWVGALSTEESRRG